MRKINSYNDCKDSEWQIFFTCRNLKYRNRPNVRFFNGQHDAWMNVWNSDTMQMLTRDNLLFQASSHVCFCLGAEVCSPSSDGNYTCSVPASNDWTYMLQTESKHFCVCSCRKASSKEKNLLQQILEATARAAAAAVEVCGLSSETESLCVKTSYYYIFSNFMFQHHKFTN